MKSLSSIARRTVAAGLMSAICASVVVIANTASLGDKHGQQVVAFKPAINALVDVLTPQGTPRVYATATGTTYWSPGSSLVIYRGDKIKLNVFVSTGAFELQHVKVRLDNVPIVSIDHQPWDTIYDTSTLDTGYHMFQIWAQSDSPSPYSSSEQNIAFYIAQPSQEGSASPDVTATPASSGPSMPQTVQVTQPPAPSPAPSPSIAPAPESMPPMAPRPPTSAAVAQYPLPRLIVDQQQTVAAVVTLQVGSAPSVMGDSLVPTVLSGRTIVTLGVPRGSTASRFVYALYRDGAVIYQCDHFLPVYGTQIVLQARTATSPGLNPGDIILKAWGVDQASNFGPPTSVAVRLVVNQ